MDDVVGSRGAVFADVRQNFFCENLFLRIELVAWVLRGPALQMSQHVRNGLSRPGRENPSPRDVMLEPVSLCRCANLGRRVNVREQFSLAISDHPVAKDKIVDPAANVDRIQLHVTVVAKRLADRLRRTGQTYSVQRKTARVLAIDGQGATHSAHA